MPRPAIIYNKYSFRSLMNIWNKNRWHDEKLMYIFLNGKRAYFLIGKERNETEPSSEFSPWPDFHAPIAMASPRSDAEMERPNSSLVVNLSSS
mmetsp:Transcript_1172/g.2400  ORF Transcript_1172/g.2400 Transcript_1172/m.2400 type:complete len:93 (+) Transcript_1172:3325-3603(+)